MSAGEKGQSKGEQISGKIKEFAGKLTGNERLKNEGRGEQVKGNVREAKEDTKGAMGGFVEGIRDDDPNRRGEGPGPDRRV
ncbi:CsbD family protein [Streptomonospora nanhaiensis]|uniref:Uncharacterized protein YjbJ (UPF0337 family) n=1 Tax=Streptomonospora nanhaiensis TaxID=1323731 RepID=A0A853BP71_9ACTN|nr:CsbD family protein [Streptomonospora nanhaiensis]MBV2365718.1 CsbD family protein [Streptomonospora nanhaiensis]NYI96515.1 uncharacterized protein YjbJ (UPF0337 family) [Streptomonospora nanhaiensis]